MVLIQVRNVVNKHSSKFDGIMQRDMFDMFGALDGFDPGPQRGEDAQQQVRGHHAS